MNDTEPQFVNSHRFDSTLGLTYGAFNALVMQNVAIVRDYEEEIRATALDGADYQSTLQSALLLHAAHIIAGTQGSMRPDVERQNDRLLGEA